ncbi:BAH domain-containing protein [Mycena indigotica]|uniref:BAH domain-containing protein n=1 Tax=Mycena indigotica TaxID=2126181 RepID=A0A8H6S0N3_9AGAR|nr:BAH domain-containing protein [Mycena indigotica]KAF7290749.1 BAH domain-containing protein [Mycena indigotica]
MPPTTRQQSISSIVSSRTAKPASISTTSATRKSSKPPSTSSRKPTSTASMRTRHGSAQPRRKKAEAAGGDPDAPGAEEWERMQVFGRFVVTDGQGQEHTFRVGDTAAILPASTPPGVKIAPHEYWVVKIKAIRGRLRLSKPDGERHSKRRKLEESCPLDVWVQIQWYYSPQEVAHLVKGFHPSHCSLYERIYSNHSETISAETFEGRISVRKFHETNPAQPPIEPDEFFCRYFLDVSKGQISLYVPKPNIWKAPALSRRPSSRIGAIPLGCICDGPYNLQDADPLWVMQMCARPTCSRFFHRRCLMENGWWIRKGEEKQPLATVSEDGDVSPPTGRDQVIPTALLCLAALPLVRGATITTGFPRVGIEGTGHFVMAAQQLVSEYMEGCQWEAVLGIDTAAIEELSAVADPLIIQQKTGAEVTMICPGCRGAI